MEKVAGVESDAEEIGGNKAELGRADANDTDDGAVDGGHDPPLPQFLAQEDCGEDGQDARDIIQSNLLEEVCHVISGRYLGDDGRRRLGL